MENYTFLRQFADSWMLLALFAFFIGVVIWVFRPGASAAYRDTADVEVREALAFCVAHFFLGCRWPSVHDRLDHDAFLALLRDQARLAGWRCAPPATVNFLLDGAGQDARREAGAHASR